jgi:hypothetical protein
MDHCLIDSRRIYTRRNMGGKMIFNKEKQCITNDDGSLIRPFTGCLGHSGMDSNSNKYRCSSLACGFLRQYNTDSSIYSAGAWKRKVNAMVKDLERVPGGLDGLYQIDGHYRSEYLDKGVTK